jgi:transcription initiation factor IIF auxiliary subunit
MDDDGQTSRVAKTREAVVKRKGWGASAIGVRGFLLVKARSSRFGPSFFYHLHEKYEIKHAMADIVASADDCPESNLNEMTMSGEKREKRKNQ